jgi:thiol-disulfide isomerase/thioredoxin
MRLQAVTAPAIVGWLVITAATGTPVRGADRPAEQILADIDATAIPKLDPGQRGDTRAMTEYLLRRKAALARKGELILELFRGHPGNPKLPALFSERWQTVLMTASDSPPDPKFAAEIDEVLAKAKDDKLKADAAFYKTILEIQTGQGGPEDTLKTVEEFIRIAPKDERGALLLYSIANQLEDSPKQTALYKRVVSDYPDSAFSGQARTSLKRLESVGRPFDLEFKDAIKGTPVSIKDLRGKVVVVDFWATWCGPCVQEIPAMKDLYAKYHGQGVEFIGVSLDHPKENGGLDDLKEFVARNEIPWPQYYQGNGWESDFSRSWGIDAIPAVFVVDRDGKLSSINARGRLDEILPELLKKGTSDKSGE